MKWIAKTRQAPTHRLASVTDKTCEAVTSSELEETTAVEVADAFARFALRVAEEPVPEVWLRARSVTDSQSSVERVSDDSTGWGRDNVDPSSGPSAEIGSDIRRKLGTPAVRQKRRWLARTLVAGAAVVTVSGVFASGLGGRAIAAMFETFTVHHLQTISPDDIYALRNQLQQLQSTGQVVNLNQYGEVKTSPTGTPEQLSSLAQAEALVRRTVRPFVGAQGVVIRYLPGMDVTFSVHVKNVNALITRLGGSEAFPESADNQPIHVHVPGVIEQTAANGAQLDQIEVPSVDVPSGVDVAQVRHALLALPFLPPDLYQKLSGTVNWKDTLFVPSNGPEQSATVNGHDAVLSPSRGWIMWLDGDTILRLMMPTTNGDVTAQQLLAEAKEISS